MVTESLIIATYYTSLQLSTPGGRPISLHQRAVSQATQLDKDFSETLAYDEFELSAQLKAEPRRRKVSRKLCSVEGISNLPIAPVA